MYRCGHLPVVRHTSQRRRQVATARARRTANTTSARRRPRDSGAVWWRHFRFRSATNRKQFARSGECKDSDTAEIVKSTEDRAYVASPCGDVRYRNTTHPVWTNLNSVLFTAVARAVFMEGEVGPYVKFLVSVINISIWDENLVIIRCFYVKNCIFVHFADKIFPVTGLLLGDHCLTPRWRC